MESMEIIYMYNLKNKNILVTGGAGFVGGHLVEELINLGAHVLIIDIVFNKKSYLYSEKLHLKAKIIKQDICDYKKLDALIKKNNIDFIFHLAAQALVQEAYEHPRQTLENNILSTINILEAVRNNPNIKGIIVASSDKAYGDLKKKKYNEEDPLSGDHPYDVSKSATDLISFSYFKTYHIPVVISRFGNIYGEGDLNFSRIIPGIARSLIMNVPLELRSNGKYVRDYLYVKDVAKGYVLLAKNIKKIEGEAFNFGSNDTYSVLKLIAQIEKILDKKIAYKIMDTARNEIPYQSLDYTKIQKVLRWRTKENIVSTIHRVIAWYRKI